MTHKKWLNMMYIEQTVKVLTLAGWKLDKRNIATDHSKEDCMLNPETGRWHSMNQLPDVLHDLNAMRKIVEAMPYTRLTELPYALGKVVFGAHTNANDWIPYRMIVPNPEHLALAFAIVMEDE